MQLLMRTLSAVLSVYMILLIIRVMLTWFRGSQSGKAFYYLSMVTDPYLNWFRGFSALRFGMFDFSPIVAFVVLGFFINIFNSIGAYGKVTVGFVVALLVNGIWSVISFILVLFIIFIVLRLISVIYGGSGFLASISAGLDSVIDPVTTQVRRLVFRNRFTPYSRQLWVSGLILLAIIIAGRFLFRYLANLAFTMPF